MLRDGAQIPDIDWHCNIRNRLVLAHLMVQRTFPAMKGIYLWKGTEHFKLHCIRCWRYISLRSIFSPVQDTLNVHFYLRRVSSVLPHVVCNWLYTWITVRLLFEIPSDYQLNVLATRLAVAKTNWYDHIVYTHQVVY